MKIQSILMSVTLLFLFSFSANSATTHTYYWVGSWCNPDYLQGDSPEHLASRYVKWSKCTALPFNYDGVVSGSSICMQEKSTGKLTSCKGFGTLTAQCGDDEIYDTEARKCAPKPCEKGYIRNEITGQCELDPNDDFCNSDDFNTYYMEASDECAAQYPDYFTNIIPSCTNREKFSFRCSQGFPKPTDPTTPIESPNRDFSGGDAQPSNPKVNDFDKPEPDQVTPDSSTDTAVLGAITNLNRDNNQAFISLNKDVNAGFADTKSQLSQLNQTNHAIGQAIVDQMNQDMAIHRANKALLLQQTSAIGETASGIVAAVGKSTDGISDALSEQTKSLSEKLDELKPCDPNQDGRSCEGKHNLDDHLTSAIVGQMNTAVEESLDSAQSELVEQAQAFAVDAGVSTIRSHIDEVFDYFIGSLPSISNCTSFSLPSPLGGEISFGCEFSVKFKALFSFLLYIYTVGSCLNILLNGLTPVAPAMTERYYHK